MIFHWIDAWGGGCESLRGVNDLLHEFCDMFWGGGCVLVGRSQVRWLLREKADSVFSSWLWALWSSVFVLIVIGVTRVGCSDVRIWTWNRL